MAVQRECAHMGCSTLIPRTKSFCSEHEYRRSRTRRERLEKEPWVFLYDLEEWKSAKLRAKLRDGSRCTFEDEKGRCPKADHLSVHHEVPLKILWERANGRRKSFVRMATDLARLRTLCSRHHNQVEKLMNKELAKPKRGMAPSVSEYAP